MLLTNTNCDETGCSEGVNNNEPPKSPTIPKRKLSMRMVYERMNKLLSQGNVILKLFNNKSGKRFY